MALDSFDHPTKIGILEETANFTCKLAHDYVSEQITVAMESNILPADYIPLVPALAMVEIGKSLLSELQAIRLEMHGICTELRSVSDAIDRSTEQMAYGQRIGG